MCMGSRRGGGGKGQVYISARVRKGSYRGEGRVGCTVFYVYSGLGGEGPKEVAEVAIDEHCSGHAGNGEVCTFCNTILGWRVRDSFFERDTVTFTMLLHFPTSEFGGVVNAEDAEAFTHEVFCCSLEFDKVIACLIMRFHEKKENEMGVTVYKHDIV